MKTSRGGQVRIIGGLLKRTPVTVVSDEASMRPTPDRVRETVFNWLGDQVAGARCLDLFAGSGALGLEAASRGAKPVFFNERNPRIVRELQTRIDSLRAANDPQVQALGHSLTLTRQDALAALADHHRAGRQFDLVFLDPPFSQEWQSRLLSVLPGVLADSALIYLERGQEVESLADPQAATGSQFERLRYARAGQVHYHLFRYQKNPDL
ncbi:MAG: 16S rRNA (guanine(966)-N(2))-methyltransferase RsmD [Burkholderiaceae bacterium]